MPALMLGWLGNPVKVRTVCNVRRAEQTRFGSGREICQGSPRLPTMVCLSVSSFPNTPGIWVRAGAPCTKQGAKSNWGAHVVRLIWGRETFWGLVQGPSHQLFLPPAPHAGCSRGNAQKKGGPSSVCGRRWTVGRAA